MRYLDYGSGVRVDHDHVDPSYTLIIPCAGAVAVTMDQRTTVGTPSVAAMICPDHRVTLEADDACPQLLITLKQTYLEATLRQILGPPPRRPLRFDPAVDLTAPSMRGWLALLDLARTELEQGVQVATHPLARRHLEHLLATGLLLALPHNHSGIMHAQPVRTSTPWQVREAMEFIHAHAAEPPTVPGIAAAAGVGVRSLQQGFRRHLATTPTTYLRHVRLEHAHADLLAATREDDLTVTDIACRWGFLHPGRFAQAYKATYGQTPSRTLRS